MNKVWAWFRKKLHHHNYEMVFENPSRPFDFTLRCKCGRTARDMSEGLSQ